jgi:hypothetical protein
MTGVECLGIVAENICHLRAGTIAPRQLGDDLRLSRSRGGNVSNRGKSPRAPVGFPAPAFLFLAALASTPASPE